MNEWCGKARCVKCRCCGKWFERGLDWGYWYGEHICCSYKCMRTMRQADRDGRPLPEPVYEPLGREAKVSEEMISLCVRMAGEGKTLADMERETGLDRRVISRHLHDRRVVYMRQKSHKRVAEGLEERAIAMKKSGVKQKDIAIQLGVSQSLVSKWVSERRFYE